MVCDDPRSATLDAGNVKLTYNALIEKVEKKKQIISSGNNDNIFGVFPFSFYFFRLQFVTFFLVHFVSLNHFPFTAPMRNPYKALY